MNDCSELICDLVAYNASLNIAHWRADTKSNEHNALGSLYDALVGETDKFAEIYMGKYGVVSFSTCELTDIKDAPAEGLKIVEELQSHFKAGEDDDLLNSLADMSAALNKAAYLLKTQPEESTESEEEEVKEEAPKKDKIKVFDTEGMPD